MREFCTPGSVRGAPGNGRPYRNITIKKNPNALRQLEPQLALTDRQIDTLVYQLYDLTPDEITIVEGKA